MYIKSHTKLFKTILLSKQENEGRQVLIKAFKMGRVFLTHDNQKYL